MFEKAIHHLPPCPETVAARPARFGQSRHAALEGVAVQIGQARNGGSCNGLRAFQLLRGRVRCKRGNHTVCNTHQHPAVPAIGEQGMFQQQGFAHDHFILQLTRPADCDQQLPLLQRLFGQAGPTKNR